MWWDVQTRRWPIALRGPVLALGNASVKIEPNEVKLLHFLLVIVFLSRADWMDSSRR
jgi:hypothetical protein